MGCILLENPSGAFVGFTAKRKVKKRAVHCISNLEIRDYFCFLQRLFYKETSEF